MSSDLDEVDQFHAGQDRILLEQAGQYGRQQEDSDILDEEVMGIDENLDDEDEQEGDELQDEFEEEEEEEEGHDKDEEEAATNGWGGRKNYYGGEDGLEDVQMMSEEALKQQRRHLQELAMDDFVDEETLETWEKTTDGANNDISGSNVDAGGSVVVDILLTSKMSSEDREELLQLQFPEFIPLLKELKNLRPKLEAFGSDPVGQVKKAALLGYLGALALYFALVMEGLRDGLASMKENPVMETILASREVWRQASELKARSGEDEDVEGVDEIEEDEEVDDLEDDVDADEIDNEEDDEEEDEEEEVEDKAISFPDVNSKRTRKQTSRNTFESDYNESTGPDSVDLEDKQRRRKTLRFYTSKIDQAAQKHTKTQGGDTDLPYRERLFERQQRLIEEARKRGLEEKDQLGEGGSDDEMAEKTNNDRLDVDADDEYYNKIVGDKSERAVSRKHAHDVAVRAAKEGKLAEAQELAGDDGKRALNFQILKNKGLTPKRNKDNRNSRVKKRKKYAKAQAKLKSVRQVYEGQKGPYEGEKTGIKKGLTRSVKLV